MPQESKTFRVFVSSTFSDMREERRILQEKVFPALQRYCESQGAKFQAIDLRWGVNEEAQLDNKTMDICLGEIGRCLKLSPRPNFLILLGDRYGWQPLPARIPQTEMDAILSHLPDVEKHELLDWYNLDENAVPAQYILIPRKRDYEDYQNWMPLEKRLLESLRKGAGACPFDKEKRIKYFASATHQEIIYGALNPHEDYPGQEEHVFACLRSIPNLREDESMSDLVEIADGKFDSYCRSSVAALRKEIEKKLSPSNIYKYQGRLKKDKDGDLQLTLDSKKRFASAVYEHFRAVVDQEIEKVASVDPLEKEINLHREFRNTLIAHFKGREDTLHAIHDFINRKEEKILCLLGQSGSGKSSVMAKAVSEIQGQYVTSYRFCGISPTASTIRGTVYSLTQEIAQRYQVPFEDLLKEKKPEGGKAEREGTLEETIDITRDTGLKKVLHKAMNIATEEKPFVLFIDAFDQLKDPLGAALDWLPREMPEHCRIIISALKDSEDKIGVRFIKENLLPMSRNEGEMILEGWLGSVERTLQEEQKKAVLDKFEENGIPLYLRLAFEAVKFWRSFDGIPDLKTNVESVLEDYFTRLEKEHGKLLVERFCGYLLSGKDRGLSEGEILSLLAFDDDYWDAFYQTSHPLHRSELARVRKLPIAVWSRLYLDLDPYLTIREGEGGNIMTFYHRQFSEYAEKRYLPDKKKLHSTMADYFETLSLYFDDAWKQPNGRKCAEQPFQQIEAEQWDDLNAKTLGNFPFVMAKVMAGLLESLLDDYRKTFRVIPQEEKERLKFWEAFFRERAHILRRGNEKWPAYKILLQLAVEHADDSPVTKGAERYLNKRKVDCVWIKRMQRLKKAGIDPCIAVLEGHTSGITGALELRDGRILSWSSDETLRLWDSYGKPLTELKGHTGGVTGAFELRDGRILSWSWDYLWSSDWTLRLWSDDGKPLEVLEGHTGWVRGALELLDGRILSWSQDKTLRLWGGDGKPLEVLEGHTGWVRGAFELLDGRILSWSQDKTLRLWGGDGKLLEVLEGHTGLVAGALELLDGRILSWSQDETLRLWGDDGKPLEVMNGHTGLVAGALELRDSRILSWSQDKTLRLWGGDGKSLEVMNGHTYDVEGVIELTDGRILSWSCDKTFRFWNRNGKFIIALVHSNLFERRNALELRDGKVLTWSDNSTLHIWDREGKELTVFKGHTSNVRGALELKNTQIISWSDDKSLRLWDQAGKAIEALVGHANKVEETLEFRDGRILSWAKDEKYLSLWDREGEAIAVLEGHTTQIRGALELINSHILSWAYDDTLRLWDHNGHLLLLLEGHSHNFSIRGAFELKGGRILSFSEGGDMCLWDKEGRLLTVLMGHDTLYDNVITGKIRAIQLTDGKILSLAADKTFRLWSCMGEPIVILKGHEGEIAGVLELQDGRILSWAKDKTLYIWDSDGHTLTVMEGHTDSVSGAIELKNGRILSWALDRTLRLWSSYGKPVVVMKGHINEVRGAIELRDGRILSWEEEENTLRLWDGNGEFLATYPKYKGFAAFPEYRREIFGKACVLSNTALNRRDNTSFLELFGKEREHCITWHSISECHGRLLKADGRMVVTQANGQVCFLRLYHGNKQITVKDLEEMYGLEYQE